MKESFKEKAYGIAYGARIGAICGGILGAVPLALEKDVPTSVLMTGLFSAEGGFIGFQHREKFWERHKAKKLTSRLTQEEKLQGMPIVPQEVKTYLQDMYEHMESNLLEGYGDKIEGNPPNKKNLFSEEKDSRLSGNMYLGVRLMDDLVGITEVFTEHITDDFTRLTQEERENLDARIKAHVALAKLGWKVNKWLKQGGSVEESKWVPYSELMVAGAFVKSTTDNRRELKGRLKGLSGLQDSLKWADRRAPRDLQTETTG